MQQNVRAIRPFVGALNYKLSRSFYRDLGFEEKVLSTNMSLFQMGNIAFYLQDAFVKDWVDNTMVFVEVENVQLQWESLLLLNLTEKYAGVKLTPIKVYDWGSECFLHDPSGILWHFGQFAR